MRIGEEVKFTMPVPVQPVFSCGPISSELGGKIILHSPICLPLQYASHLEIFSLQNSLHSISPEQRLSRLTNSLLYSFTIFKLFLFSTCVQPKNRTQNKMNNINTTFMTKIKKNLLKNLSQS